MLDVEGNAFGCIKEAMTWDLSIKLMNTDAELQW